ncbi:MAG: hypothetical protein JWM48_25 [Mycobacterium sp.]|nr:hypothetical protein [Mycobacterium sp.]MCW2743475.1 hypothetical protein [Mycobacterium sp.]
MSESETRGTTAPAGAGVDDQEMVAEVEEQTSNDLEAEPAFEQEAGGVDSPDEAAKGGTA